MTDVARLRTLRAGIHSTAFDYTGTPTTLPLRIVDDGDSFLPRNRNPIERNLRSLSGRRYSHVRGTQNVDDLTVALEARGADNGTAAVADWEAVQEAGELLESIFGAAATATTGAATTVAASGHTPASGVLGVATSTDYVAGEVVAFSSSEGLQVGRIASKATGELTLEHPYSGTPTTGASVFRLAVYLVDDDLTAHRHMAFDAEGENWRRIYKGCMPMGLEIALPVGERAMFTFTFSPSTWAADDPANPAHAEPTSGQPIVVDRLKLLIDGVEFIAVNATIRVDCATQPRGTLSKTNGRFGGVCAATEGGKMIQIEGEFYLGDNVGTFNEIEDNDGTPELRDLTGDNDSAGDVSATREVVIQCGTEIDGVLYAFLPTADFVAAAQTTDGFTTVRFTATGTGAVPGLVAFG